MYEGLHTHGFRDITSFNFGHTHKFSGTTSLDPNFPGHVHQMAAVTTFNDGHIHRLAVLTGPDIPVRRGRHIHPYIGVTTFNDGHTHFFRGYTST